MSTHCAHSHGPPSVARGFRTALWIALALNAGMFVIEAAAGFGAHSVALQADAVDFFGDASNYAVSLLVLGFAAVWRSYAALLKALAMALFGVGVLASAAYASIVQPLPGAAVMGGVGALALAVNIGVTFLLYRFRGGDANMRSVWLCTRNDAIGNLSVLLAALGVFGSGTGWPDLAVAAIMAVLALTAAVHVGRHAFAELRPARAPAR